MSRGTADDDAPIEITPEIIEGSLEADAPVGASRPSFTTAAAADPEADLAFYLEEAAQGDAARAPGLLYEIGRIRERALGDGEAALASYRQALAGDGAFLAAWGALRRTFAARELWTDLTALLDHGIGIQGAALPARDRADLGVERGRVLEDRLARRADAAASYRAALEAAPDHTPALLARLMLAVRVGERDGIDAALAGLARRAGDRERRAALAAERARAQRRADGAAGADAPGAPDAGDGGASAALHTVRDAIAACAEGPGDGEATARPPAALLSELEQLARLGAVPRVQIDALELLARHAPNGDAALEAALHRQRARLLRDAAGEPEAAFQALATARRLAPEHPLATVEMLDVADQLGRADLIAALMDEIDGAHGGSGPARQAGAAASSDASGAAADTAPAERAETAAPAVTADDGEAPDNAAGPIDATIDAAAAARAAAALVASRLVEALARSGRAAEALERLRVHAQPGARGDDAAARAVHVALLAETGDAAGLAAAFEGQAERSEGAAAAHALVRAATLRDRVLNDAEDPQRRVRAEALYRRALAIRPGYAPAVDGLEALLRAEGRWADLARVFQDDLAQLPPGDSETDGDGASASEGAAAAARARRRYLIEQLVALHRDRLGDLGRALDLQRRLVALDPGDLGAWVVARDLELSLSLSDTAAEGAVGPAQVTTLSALAERAGDAGVAAALRAEAARLAGATAAAEALYRQARAADGSGLAAGGLAALLAEPSDRMDAIASELAAADAGGPTARALRFRLAWEHAAARRFPAAIDLLRPLRARGDAVAGALSYQLARQSGDATLALTLLREADGAAPAGLGAASDLGEALERLGDRAGADEAFRQVLRRGRPTGPADAVDATDAALGLLRLTATAEPPEPGAVVAVLRALADAATDNPAAAAGATREADRLDAALGRPVTAPVASGPGTSPDDALLAWMTGVRAADHGRVAGALLDLAAALDGGAGARSLLARAAARSRLASPATADAVHRRAWSAAPGDPALAHSASDLPAASSAGAWAEARAARPAASAPTAGLAMAVDLERALDDETAGRLGAALGAYGRVLGRDADHLEAMEGVRRVARAAGDGLGEARALARLGALVKTPARSGRLYAEAGELYEAAGRADEAIAAYTKALGRLPADDAAFGRLAGLLRARAASQDPAAAKAAAQALDRLLSHRLQHRAPTGDAGDAIALLAERARNRLRRLDDRENAVEDFKRILKIDARHEDSLRQLATLAIEMRYPADAAKLLERYLAVVEPHDAAAADVARLELAQSLEHAHDRPRAIETLKQAVALRPGDTVPLERLANLYVRSRDWAGAIGALNAWEQAVTDGRFRSDLHMRIGTLLRDQAYDLPAAAMSFQRAAELDPLGDGTAALAQLYESAGDKTARRKVIDDAIAEMRRQLQQDPLDLPRLRRLRELLDKSAGAGDGEATRAVAEVLALVGQAPAVAPAGDDAARPRIAGPDAAAALWAAAADPAALGFLTEVWPLLADAALELHPVNAAELGAVRQNRLVAGAEPRLAWLEEAAASLGLAGVALHLALHPTARDDGEVKAVELPAPALVFGAAAVAGGGAAVFWFGRALGALRQRATVLARLAPEELQGLFVAAAAVAGAAAEGGGARPGDATAEVRAKALGRALGRREKKALGLQASRFGFEPIDAAAWQRAVLRTSDRLGLVLSGDVVASARALGGFGEIVTPADVWRQPAVVDLLRFALSEAYLTARRQAGLARGAAG
jgi:hypothetical protein